MKQADLVIAIVENIKPHLAGVDSALQGAALAELTAIWLAGHPQPMLENLLQLQLRHIDELTEFHVAMNEAAKI